MLFMAAGAFIQCRVSQATKAALPATAERQQLTDSALIAVLSGWPKRVEGQERIPSDPSSAHGCLSARYAVGIPLRARRAEGAGPATVINDLIWIGVPTQR